MATGNCEAHLRLHVEMKETEESILNRKRELRGLSSSFSSNIGQRNSPSYLSSSTNTSTNKDGRSVKSIVAWLESASTNPDISRCSGDDITSVHSIGTISSAGSNSSLLSRQTIPGAVDVEEYSLTILKYKKYYTEVPLGRCLDAQAQDNATTSSAVRVENESTEVSLLEDFEDCSLQFDQCSTSNQQLSRPLESCFGAGLVVAMGHKEQNVMTTLGNESACSVEEVPVFCRDHEEVLAF